jgi:hypothetical protein
MISPNAALDAADAREWLTLAKRGDFASAWQASDRILQRHIADPDFTRPRHFQSVWRGEPLTGKRVLIRCYHGLGDTIQFIRYAPLVRAIAREVVVWAQAPLLPVLRATDGIDRLLPLHDGMPDVEFDVDLEVMELPYIFRSTLETIPRQIPYLTVPSAVLPGRSPRVGIVWRAGDWETQRSMPFELLRPLLDVDRLTWCSLQQGRRSNEAHPGLVDVSTADLYQAAMRVAAMDLVITVDSMPAHLAGAMGTRVWTLLLNDADWRWMEDRDSSPWYPTMRLFRQPRGGGWPDVIEAVRAALTAEF